MKTSSVSPKGCHLPQRGRPKRKDRGIATPACGLVRDDRILEEWR